MKLLILVMCAFFVGCGGQSKAEQHAADLYARITAQVHSGDRMSGAWADIEKNILANKKVLFMVASEEFSILVVRNTFNMSADTAIYSAPDTSGIVSSPQVDEIENAVARLEKLAKRMGGK